MPGLAAHFLSIIRENYQDFGPTLACEKLAELHGIFLCKETVRKLMIEARLWIPRRQRAPKIQQPRYRRPCTGELIQIDGCDHDWFEGRGPKCTALVYVDDATSKIMELLFVKSESTFTYYEATRRYIEKMEQHEPACLARRRCAPPLHAAGMLADECLFVVVRS